MSGQVPSPLQHRLHDLLSGDPRPGDRLAAVVNYTLFAVILLTSVVLVAGTVPSVAARWSREIRLFDLVAGSLFLVEYLLRLWSAPANPRYADGWRGRLRWTRSPFALIDLLATVALLTPWLGVFREARFVRLLALLRIGHAGRVGRSVAMASRIIHAQRTELLLSLGAIAFLLLVGSTAVYYAEHEAQPRAFGSIPAALWWGVATVTTVGYGDVYPVTVAGRILGGILAVLGISSFALPTAILGGAFMRELQRRETLRGESHCPTCGQRVHRHHAWHDDEDAAAADAAGAVAPPDDRPGDSTATLRDPGR